MAKAPPSIFRPTQVDYFPLVGLDEESAITMPARGALLGCQNYESVFGVRGVRRIAGYERFDGKDAPSDAVYYRVAFDAGGTTAIAVGNTITTATGSAYVLSVTLTSGAWANSNAAGTLVVTALTGTITDNQTINVSASPRATAAADAVLGAVGDTNYATDIVLARDYYRGLIATGPTGSGPIRGMKFWRGYLYVLRNATDGLTATLWRSSTGGWVSIRTGLRPGGTMRAVVATFSGDSAAQALYCVDGKNRYWRVEDDDTFTYGDEVYGSEAEVGGLDAIAVGSPFAPPTNGAHTIGIFPNDAYRTWVAGDQVFVYAQNNAASWFIGTVVSHTAPTGGPGAAAMSLTVTSQNNAGSYAYWHLCSLDEVDRPHYIASHKNYLFLGYPRGQVQTTDLGEPMTFTNGGGATAVALGIGDDIRGFTSLRGDVLGIFHANGVSMLYGADSATFELKPFTRTSGCRADSMFETGGNALFVSDAGIQALAGSQDFGDFSQSNLAAKARRSEQRINAGFECASIIRSDSQYRAYGADKSVLCMTWQSQAPTPKSVAFTVLRYDHQPVCSESQVYNDEEFSFFGTDDGKVFRERIGTTFDGAPIEAFVRTSYWHHNAPQSRKRWRKITLDIDSGLVAATLNFRQDLDFQGPDQGVGYSQVAQTSGGTYDGNYFGEFFYSDSEAAQVHANVDGIGTHMSLVLWSSGDSDPHTISGMHATYSPLKLQK